MSTLPADFKIGVIPLGELVIETSSESDVSRVVQAIMRTVDPESWVTGGGAGTIVALKPTFDKVWRLTVLNSKTNIETIGQLTKKWRDNQPVVTGTPIMIPPP